MSVCRNPKSTPASNLRCKRPRFGRKSRTSFIAAALSLSGGQQQRLCIARTIAIRPEVILFDEPCSALDPISTARVEATIDELKNEFTIAIVTHNMQQAARVSQHTAFMYLGELVEFGDTKKIFTNPSDTPHPRLHHGPFRLTACRRGQIN